MHILSKLLSCKLPLAEYIYQLTLHSVYTVNSKDHYSSLSLQSFTKYGIQTVHYTDIIKLHW